MFDDLISRDENYIVKSLHGDATSHAIDQQLLESSFVSLTRNLGYTIDEIFSKDSKNFRYSYGRLNGMVPEKSAYFHTQFPRKSTNLDSEYHTSGLDADFVSRWIPRSVLKVFVPILYFQDLKKNEEKKRSKKQDFEIEYHMTARPVPTIEELHLCQTFNGRGVWDRNGTWFCTSQDVSSTPYKKDKYGPQVFRTYNSWISWELKIQNMIEDAKLKEDWDTVKALRTAKNPPTKS